eukprot:13666005-Alexandrium_andersonii.AAC.1
MHAWSGSGLELACATLVCQGWRDCRECATWDNSPFGTGPGERARVPVLLMVQGERRRPPCPWPERVLQS